MKRLLPHGNQQLHVASAAFRSVKFDAYILFCKRKTSAKLISLIWIVVAVVHPCICMIPKKKKQEKILLLITLN